MIVRCMVVALCCILMTACQMVVTPPESGDTPFQLDQPIALAVGETATLEDPVLDSTIAVTFEGVREDTRCPDSREVDVMCAWSGAVEVEMTAVVNGQSETFGLTGITDYDGVVEASIGSETDSTIWYFENYYFELKQVTPYPGDERPQPDRYITTIIVSRVADPLPTPTETTATIENLMDESGKPLLCVSEMAFTEWAGGATDELPSRLTPPIAADSVPSIQSADEICAIVYGEEWRIADDLDIEGMWATRYPTDTSFWIWDNETDAVIEHE